MTGGTLEVVDEPGADERARRVYDGDRKCGLDRNGRAVVDDKRPSDDRRPGPVSHDQERRERNSSRRPYGRHISAGERNRQTSLPGEDVGDERNTQLRTVVPAYRRRQTADRVRTTPERRSSNHVLGTPSQRERRQVRVPRQDGSSGDERGDVCAPRLLPRRSGRQSRQSRGQRRSMEVSNCRRRCRSSQPTRSDTFRGSSR